MKKKKREAANIETDPIIFVRLPGSISLTFRERGGKVQTGPTKMTGNPS